jgi:hypothetical protein
VHNATSIYLDLLESSDMEKPFDANKSILSDPK